VTSLLVILSRLAENIERLWAKNLVIDRLFMQASKRSAMHSLKQFWRHLKEPPSVRDTRSQHQQVVLPESQLNVRSQEQRSSAGQGTANPIPSPSPAASIPSVTVPPEAGVEGMPRRTRSGREVRTPAYLRDFKLDKPFWTLN